jgi:hypothetical protein
VHGQAVRECAGLSLDAMNDHPEDWDPETGEIDIDWWYD